MKQIPLIIGALLFSTFFYNQNIGLNLSLFTLLTIILLVITNTSAFKKQSTIFISLAYLTSGITVFLYDSNLTVFTNILSFITLVGSVSNHSSSVYIQWINGLYTTIVAAFSQYYDSLNTEIKNVQKQKIDYLYWAKLILIPTVILIIFSTLYRIGNPKFDALISQVDLSFINFQWILLSGLGYYLLYNITNPITIEPITELDTKTGNELQKKEELLVSQEKLKKENQLGIVLMFSLNVLIVLYLITDMMYLSELHNMNGTELSKQVHNGVNALIVSIIFAILILLYFFRGDLNFFKQNKSLKNLAFVWIFLNINLVVLTAIKNFEYIQSFGFTYKRIGVLVYLLLTLIGLITTFIKVQNIKNLWFLFRKNSQIAFIILIIASSINWDNTITNYNINYAEQTDVDYLLSLSNNNIFILKQYANNSKINFEQKFDIDTKHLNYLQELQQNSWQEMVYDNLIVKE
ncbi:DUF4153 domain-containing protein [Urechidicola croceus]|uniref:Uncharacterized protein n=1 Tax=Urechidicola croceus TaxID=1850246 RepID=A0A1D8PB07_9FLAO|nr:DUF4173 domain-containing protein [Urechidicola croceus]AOW21749.1 hypothetical protein LPB138_14145 [Urechidicola croceus]